MYFFFVYIIHHVDEFIFSFHNYYDNRLVAKVNIIEKGDVFKIRLDRMIMSQGPSNK